MYIFIYICVCVCISFLSVIVDEHFKMETVIQKPVHD
jgi:hypothetical protein